jgi:hypothetical protein
MIRIRLSTRHKSDRARARHSRSRINRDFAEPVDGEHISPREFGNSVRRANACADQYPSTSTIAWAKACGAS